MTSIYLLAQELPVPEGYKGTVVSIVCGLMAGCVPFIIQMAKARAEFKKEDRNLTAKERNQLVVDLRAERMVLRDEFKLEKAEWKAELDRMLTRHATEMAALRKENLDCLQTTARQQQLIAGLTKDIEALHLTCKTLECNLEKLNR